jgi:2-methylcitrate dehydratase
MTQTVTLPANTNQALGIAHYAIDFMSGEPGRCGEPSKAVLDRTDLFHTDAVLCGLSALVLGTNAPNVLRREAFEYAVPAGNNGKGLGRSTCHGATVFGSSVRVKCEKAILANCSAVREWDSNGTNFGFNPQRGHTAGEFGHNDFYPVCIAAAQMLGEGGGGGGVNGDGAYALLGMVCLDEIRGRLAEVFSLKSYKIDHVLHGAVASAAVFGAMVGATAEQIESAIGMVVAHHVPFRAIRAGKQLSDSKGSSAAISTEAAIVSVKRSMAGFMGPRDIFRNPEAVYRMFEGPGQMAQMIDKDGTPKHAANVSAGDDAPFELVLSRAGEDFAVMGMHFKLGLYEHQSAGALQALITLLGENPSLLDEPQGGAIAGIRIVAYEPAFGIIGDPAKRNPTTRQSADHSMTYIVSTMLRKALEQRACAGEGAGNGVGWKELMLAPADYAPEAINNPLTRSLMEKITFSHGGKEYDDKYPDGIPTSMVITAADGTAHDSGLVMYPGGHARNALGKTPVDLNDVLAHKFALLSGLVSGDAAKSAAIVSTYADLSSKGASQIASLNDAPFEIAPSFD